MQSFRKKIHNLALSSVQIITLLLTFFLFIGSFLATCYAENMDTQVVLTRLDSPIWNILGILVMLTLFLGAIKLLGQNIYKLKKLLLVLTLGWIILLGVMLILFSKTVPAADAMSVYAAAESLAAGNTSVIHPTDSYLSYYPQQVGLMAFLELLFRIWNLFCKLLPLAASLPAYHFIKGIYLLLLCAAIYFQYKSVHLLWENDATDCLYLLLAGTNLPMIMYSSFVYGEVPSFTAFSVGLYCLLLGIRQIHTYTVSPPVIVNKTSLRALFTLIISILFLVLSVMLRKNSLILIIAVLLAVFFESLRQKSKTGFICALAYVLICATLSCSILPLVQKSYELRANNTLKSGVPAMTYLAMGMQEASRGCGWYNGFNIDTYRNAGMDSSLANEQARLAISDRLAEFKSNPGYAFDFYLQKHLSQWADGTYASRQATLATFGGRREVFHSLYAGNLSKYFIEYGNVYQNVLYLGVVIFCLGAVISGKRISKSKQKATAFYNSLYMYIGLIGVIGGFLFHIIWEANSRYIFVYGLLLMPYAAKGWIYLYKFLSSKRK